jgi:hypothetical protein
MKRLFRNKKTLKNLLIGLAVLAVLYYILGSTEGFQTATKEYYGNTAMTNQSPLVIPASDIAGRKIQNIQIMVYNPARNMPGTEYTEFKVGASSPLDISTSGTQIKVEGKSANGTMTTLRGSRYNRPLARTEKKLGDATMDVSGGIEIKNMNTSTLNILNGGAKDDKNNGANLKVVVTFM